MSGGKTKEHIAIYTDFSRVPDGWLPKIEFKRKLRRKSVIHLETHHMLQTPV